jgi:hypothetical protein
MGEVREGVREAINHRSSLEKYLVVGWVERSETQHHFTLISSHIIKTYCQEDR